MLTLICGLPRVGKTTYAIQFPDVIHLDTSGGYQGVLRRLQHKDGDLIVEGVYHLQGQRERLIKAYNGESFKCIWLDTPHEIRKARKGWDKFCDLPFEPPTFSEGWDEIIIIRGEHDVQSYRNENKT